MQSEAAEILAMALEADAVAQECGRIDGIGMRYDEIELQVLPINDIPDQVYGMVFSFWDCWLDAKNHDWQYHEPISESDWPRLARVIARSVREFSIPLDPLIRTHFLPDDPHQKASLIQQIKKYFSRRA